MTTKILPSEDPMGVAQVALNPPQLIKSLQAQLVFANEARGKAWDVAKSLQTQLNIAENALKLIAIDAANGNEYDTLIATAANALRQLKEHRES